METQFKKLQKDYKNRAKEMAATAKKQAKAKLFDEASRSNHYATIYKIAARDLKSILSGKKLFNMPLVQ